MGLENLYTKIRLKSAIHNLEHLSACYNMRILYFTVLDEGLIVHLVTATINLSLEKCF